MRASLCLLEYEVIRRTVALSTKCDKFNYINVLAVAIFSTFGCTNIAKNGSKWPRFGSLECDSNSLD